MLEVWISLSNLKKKNEVRDFRAEQLTKKQVGRVVEVSGWVEDIRPLGSISFLTLRDPTGISQIVFNNKNVSATSQAVLSALQRQSIVSVKGVVQESRSQKVEVEILADHIQLLSAAKHPLPLDPTGRVPSSIDARLDARALDLRTPSVAAIFRIRNVALQAVRSALLSQEFVEVSTPKVIGNAVEGGANLFSVGYFGKKAFLAQSPQLFKEQLVISLERVFEIASYYRAEKSHTTRHLSEFYGIDVEAAYMSEEEVMVVAEDVISRSIQKVSRECVKELRILSHELKTPKVPFPRVSYANVVEDLRGQENKNSIRFGDDLTDGTLSSFSRFKSEFFWIVDWPSQLKPFYLERGDNGLARSFDLQHGKLELASGGKRVSTRAELEGNLKKAGLRPKNFENHLRVFDWGMPPHSGWGMGFDRLMMVLTGRKNVREVVFYPRDRFRLDP